MAKDYTVTENTELGNKFNEFLELFGVKTDEFVNMTVTGFSPDDNEGVKTLFTVARMRDPFTDPQEQVNAAVAAQNTADGFDNNGEQKV